MSTLKEKAEWLVFLKGKWTKEPPKVAGVYPVATRDGTPATPVVVYYSQLRKSLCATKIGWTMNISKDESPNTFWKGYWWSCPMPQMPKCPRWD